MGYTDIFVNILSIAIIAFLLYVSMYNNTSFRYDEMVEDNTSPVPINNLTSEINNLFDIKWSFDSLQLMIDEHSDNVRSIMGESRIY
uniref:Uncharacterized protein n=1 Tax=viral metagenome TaxID=1070528 RepID=A0A6C0BRC0_9ZZZZ